MDRSFVFQWASCTVLAKQSAWAAPIRMSSCISIGGTNFASICTPAKRIERRNHERSLAKLPDVCKLSQQLAALLDEVVVIAGRHARLHLFPGTGNRYRSGTKAFLELANQDVHPAGAPDVFPCRSWQVRVFARGMFDER